MIRRLLPACLLALCPVAQAAEMHLDWNLRLRHEGVDDAALARTAAAQSLRLRLALRIGLAPGWTALVEGEGIAAGGDFNSGSNGRTALPAITDPPGSELNQAWLGWRGTRAGATVGRQKLEWDNQRWLGSVGWRQNQQTFDALLLEASPQPDLTIQYAWLGRVHRVAGDEALDPLARERRLASHALRIARGKPGQGITAYALLHEDRDVPGASSATYGLRWTGSRGPRLGWTAEIATQGDHADNPASFQHAYWLLEPSLRAADISWKLGWEHLGGDGQHALQTPLATLHAFNGWADRFASTPAAGLDDAWLSGTGKLGASTWTLAWHDYRSDAGSARYGSEWNLALVRAFGPRWTGTLKLADYRAQDLGSDARKFWLQFEYQGSRPL